MWAALRLPGLEKVFVVLSSWVGAAAVRLLAFAYTFDPKP